jgi:hypothetical protein
MDTILIDRPADPVSFAARDSSTTLWYVQFPVPSVHLSLVCRSSLRRPLYTKKRYHTSGLSANRYISLFGLDESRRPTRQEFSSQLPFVLDATLLNTCPRVSASSTINPDRMIPHIPRTYAVIVPFFYTTFLCTA